MKRFGKRLVLGLTAILASLVLASTAAGPAAEAAGYQSAVQYCLISGDHQSVMVSASVKTGLKSDDKQLYLFALPTYAAGITGEPAAAAALGQSAVFTVPLNAGTASTRLFSKFVLAVKRGGQFVQISEAQYINNPEALAAHTMAYPEGVSKKGLMISPGRYESGEIEELGIKQVTCDVPVNRLFGETTDSACPTIEYEYNGKSYRFNGSVVERYDSAFGALTEKGAVVTAVLLNELDPACLQTTHPYARTQTAASYYMFNAAEEEGVEYLSAAAAFLAERYSGTGKGSVHNWIIGNEITARSSSNFIAPMDVGSYTAQYARALRVFYTAVKSVNANARVFISLDQTWDKNSADGTGYDGRDIIDLLVKESAGEGNYDWGVAIHPYPAPQTWPMFWHMPPQYAAQNLVQFDEKTPVVTAANISAFTDYMCKPENLTRAQQVRPLMVSEIGFPSVQGEDIQAAAIAYAYYNAAAYNQHIDAFILARDIDRPGEEAQGLNMGLKNADGSEKYAYDVYKQIDTPSGPAVTEFAKSRISITSWTQVIQPR